MTNTWDKLPLEAIDWFAEREAINRNYYRPIYSLHKWWARRPGTTFRALGLAMLTDDRVHAKDILRENTSGSFDGLYFQDQQDKFSDKTVLDPFVGGGTTLFELNRLGAQTIGYELNPVAWWTAKKSIDEADLKSLRAEFEQLLNDVRQELDKYYTTKDPDTGKECEILYSLQTQEVECLSCGESVHLFPRYELGKKKKTSPAVVYCKNNDCDDRIEYLDHEIGETETCSSCGEKFDPSEGTYGYGKFTCSNGHKSDVKESLQRNDKKPDFEYFAIYYRTPSGKKKFKEPDGDDMERVRQAEKKLAEIRESLPVPSQKIPEGDKTRALRNYNYEHFSELFTDRHLLTFGTLFNRAKEIEDRNIREFLITAVSAALTRNSKLCKWNTGRKTSLNVFQRHAYIPVVQPVEGNPLNRAQNITALENHFDKVYDAKEYCQRPFEKVKNTKTGDIEKHYIQNESVSEDRLLSLRSKTSERLDEPDQSVDYVITDPPYYDNVQYSELSDYFYVWLHQALKEDYSEFEPELVPKAREIVANKNSGKSEQFFINSLSNVFSECHRVLKDDGEMVFTYHHNKNEAWSVILQAIVDSGFTVTAAYPVQSERSNNPHITDLDNAEYDILIFTNKEDAADETTLDELRQDLFFELQDIAETERSRHDSLSQADLGVILRGKCMYYYSKHYPNVYSDGEVVGIDEALDTVDSVIEQVLEGSVNLPASIDSLTQAYAAFCQRGSESFDELNKILLGKNLNVSDLEDEKLVKGAHNKKEPVSADERVRYIERKLNKNGSDGETLLDIDKVQYLYHLYKTDQNTAEYLKDWKSDDRQGLAEFMAEVTGDERYESVMEMSLSQF